VVVITAVLAMSLAACGGSTTSHAAPTTNIVTCEDTPDGVTVNVGGTIMNNTRRPATYALTVQITRANKQVGTGQTTVGPVQPRIAATWATSVTTTPPPFTNEPPNANSVFNEVAPAQCHLVQVQTQ